MPAPEPQIDIEALLAPISESSPSGRSIVYEETYDRIKKARLEDDPSLPQGVWQGRTKAADWGAVASLAAEAIENKSKDLKLACWLGDAWGRLHGIAGVAAASELACGLCERYWDSLYPELDDEGPAPRLGLLDWLDRALESSVLLAPLIGSDDGSRALYRLADWHAAMTPRGAGAAAGAVTTESFLAAASLMGSERWAEIQAETETGIQAIATLDAVVSTHVADAPSALHRTRRALETILGFAQQALAAVGEGAIPGQPGEPPARAPAPRPGAAGPLIASRAEAYALLNEAADYLFRTEPHSPVPYLVKRAVAWGNLPLGDLLHELVAGPNDLEAIKKLLGMKR